jgi:transcriptional regulator with XRE-family HTH domain
MIGDRIRKARKKLGLSLEELAEQVGLEVLSLKLCESNDGTPFYETIVKISETLHISEKYLIMGHPLSL